jgi:hypothetical protein
MIYLITVSQQCHPTTEYDDEAVYDISNGNILIKFFKNRKILINTLFITINIQSTDFCLSVRGFNKLIFCLLPEFRSAVAVLLLSFIVYEHDKLSLALRYRSRLPSFGGNDFHVLQSHLRCCCCCCMYGCFEHVDA